MSVRGRPAETTFTPTATFALRTPLLPWDDLEGWSHGLSGASPEAVGHLRARLIALLARPEIDEAIHVASPALHASLDAWREKPTSERGQKVEGALVRYLVRMASRATPFGLFSGVGSGEVGRATHLAVPPIAAQIRRSRLDNDVLFALADALARDPERRRFLRFSPNSSLYQAAGRLRYAEARMGAGGRNYHLVSVEPSPYLDATLARAAGGARLGDLAAALCADDPEIELADAEAFVGELADTQILVPDLGVAVTGPEPIDAFLVQLERAELADVADRIRRIRSALAEADAGGVATSARHAEIHAALDGLPVKPDASRLVQVDLVRPPSGATLGAAVVKEITRAVEALRKMTPVGESPLAEFRRAFNDRYEGREVPLVEVLDEESGIGFEVASGPGSEGSPLLAGLRFPGAAGELRVRWGGREHHLVRRLGQLAARGERELVLTEADLTALAVREPRNLPDAWATMFRIAAASGEAVDRGDFAVLVDGAGGPSGARVLGRFCHASPAIDDMVREHLRAEEALRPDAVFAEIVHLTEGRIGNILCRPVLRDYEIEYLGQSGAPADRRLPLTDLLVSVAGDRVVLRSRRLGREVVPRLSSAHNVRLRSLGVYRFLAALQGQGGEGVGWSWGALDSTPFLPRVRLGKTVLQRARWRLHKEELDALSAAVKAGGIERIFAAVQALRAARDLPQVSVVADGDNELALDLDNAMCAAVFADTLAGRTDATVLEAFPAPDRLCAVGEAGRFTHEAVLCFVRTPSPTPTPTPTQTQTPTPSPTPSPSPSVPRRLAPGSSCLYLKLYTGTASADRLLRDVVAPITADAIASGAASHWFFLRYSDPQHHLRVRFFGEPSALLSSVLPAMQAATAPLLDDGSMWRVQVDTYDRETERYGGPAGIELCEKLFWLDSEAVLDALGVLAGDAGADLRWIVGLRGAEQILVDLGLDDAARAEVWTSARDSLDREHRTGTDFHKQLGERFRGRKTDIDRVLTLGDAAALAASEDDPLGLAVGALIRRSERSQAFIAELRARDEAGALTPRIRGLAWSVVHMHLNRLLHASQRSQELVLYDFLRRWHAARRARPHTP